GHEGNALWKEGRREGGGASARHGRGRKATESGPPWATADSPVSCGWAGRRRRLHPPFLTPPVVSGTGAGDNAKIAVGHGFHGFCHSPRCRFLLSGGARRPKVELAFSQTLPRLSQAEGHSP